MTVRGVRGSTVGGAPLALALLPLDDIDTHIPDRFGLALAPDGRRLAMTGTKNGVSQLWLRDLTTNDVQPLPGTMDAVQPFWSSDGAALGFFSNDRLRVFVFADGSVRDLAEARSPQGAAWHPNGDIVFASRQDGPLERRSADGQVTALTTLDPHLERSHRFPQLSADGRHLIFFVQASEPIREGLWIAPYADPAARKRLVKSDAHGLLAADSLIYSSEGALVGQRVDRETLRLSGRSLLIGTHVGRTTAHELFASVGGNVLLFGAAPSLLRELRWLDRGGAILDILGEPMEAREGRIDPSGERVAVSRLDQQLNTLDIWMYEGDRPVPRKLSLNLGSDESPVWSPDGRRLAWATGRYSVTIRQADAVTPEETLRRFEHAITVTDWTPSNSIVVSEARDDTRSDIVVVPVDSANAPRTYAATPFNETYGVVSPDGRWLAYASDESGRFDIYVDSFPSPGHRGRISIGGGTEPRWAADGHTIFFRRGSEIHAARVEFAGGAPQAVTSARLFDAGAELRSFDVAPDGVRFLVNVGAPDSGPRPMSAIVNVRSRLAALYDRQP
jgi:Tol biopolymer transport system component